MSTINLETYRHSLSHILALALRRIYGREVKFATGPATAEGFFYDISLPKAVSEKSLLKIQQEMEKIVKEKLSFQKKLMPWKEAVEFFKTEEQNFKLEILEEIALLEAEKSGEEITKTKQNLTVTTYQLGDFEDLCRGPHLENTGEIQRESFLLTKTAGAYFQNDEKNEMLTRIYGIAFPNKKELKKYLFQREEAKKRDHRKLGKELDLFHFSDLVGPGLPLFTPKGTAIKEELQKRVEKICRNYGFQKVSTPHLAKIELYEISGHKQKFGDELFHVKSHHKQNYVLKPVQCPHQTQIYASNPRSYRDLPIRYMESEKQYRDEKPGEISGLGRVIAITVEDGHSFCRVDQVKEEIIGMIKIIKDFYSALGMWENHWVSLSVRDPKHPEKYIGEPKDWDKCEAMLQEISDEMQLEAKRQEGEAALYGPKLDFMFRDALGKEIQIPTVQVDFATAKRFDLFYTDEKGQKVPPVMVHRAILGSYERFMALLIEHFAGSFPFWLAPVQIKVISVGEKHIPFCEKLQQEFLGEDFRSQVDKSNETVGKKIHGASSQKIPYVLVIGDREVESDIFSVRSHENGTTELLSKKDFFEKIRKERE